MTASYRPLGEDAKREIWQIAMATKSATSKTTEIKLAHSPDSGRRLHVLRPCYAEGAHSRSGILTRTRRYRDVQNQAARQEI